MQSRKSKSRPIRKIAIAAAVWGGLLAAGWVVLHLSPRAYVPAEPAYPDQLSPYLTHELGPVFYNNVQLNEPFELVVQQAGLNEILAQGDWPQRYGDVSVGRAAVTIENDAIYLMSRIEYHGFSSILTIAARPVMVSGEGLNLNIRSVRLGLAPITALAARMAESAIDENAALLGDPPELEALMRAIVSNTPFEPVFDFGKQRIRLDGFAIEPGRLRLKLTPQRAGQ